MHVLAVSLLEGTGVFDGVAGVQVHQLEPELPLQSRRIVIKAPAFDAESWRHGAVRCEHMIRLHPLTIPDGEETRFAERQTAEQGLGFFLFELCVGLVSETDFLQQAIAQPDPDVVATRPGREELRFERNRLLGTLAPTPQGDVPLLPVQFLFASLESGSERQVDFGQEAVGLRRVEHKPDIDGVIILRHHLQWFGNLAVIDGG